MTMIQPQDAFIDTEDFHFQLNHQEVMQLSFGPTRISMSLDSAYELQYQLAAFLADFELGDYVSEKIQKNPHFAESQEALRHLSSQKQLRRLDS